MGPLEILWLLRCRLLVELVESFLSRAFAVYLSCDAAMRLYFEGDRLMAIRLAGWLVVSMVVSGAAGYT